MNRAQRILLIFPVVIIFGGFGAIAWLEAAHPEKCVQWRTEKVTRCIDAGPEYCRAFGEPHDERFCVERRRP